MYEINLIDTTHTYVLETLILDASSRDEALLQRPDHWPVSRTRARAIRTG